MMTTEDAALNSNTVDVMATPITLKPSNNVWTSVLEFDL